MIILRTPFAAATVVFFAVACTANTTSTPPAAPIVRTNQATVRAGVAAAVTPTAIDIFPSLVIGGAFGPSPAVWVYAGPASNVDRTLQISSSNPAADRPA